MSLHNPTKKQYKITSQQTNIVEMKLDYLYQTNKLKYLHRHIKYNTISLITTIIVLENVFNSTETNLKSFTTKKKINGKI